MCTRDFKYKFEQLARSAVKVLRFIHAVKPNGLAGRILFDRTVAVSVGTVDGLVKSHWRNVRCERNEWRNWITYLP
jgi:hypothetical protein